MVFNWAICIAVAAAIIHRVQLVVVSEDIRFLKVHNMVHISFEFDWTN